MHKDLYTGKDMATPNPAPGAWTTFRGKRLKVLRARMSSNGLDPGALDGLRVGAGDGALELVEVQPEGKAAMPATAWLNGAHPRSDERLGG